MRPFPEPDFQQVQNVYSKISTGQDTKAGSNSDRLSQESERCSHHIDSQHKLKCFSTSRWCSVFGVSLLMNHSFGLFCMAGFWMEFGHVGTFSFLPLRAVELGVSKQNAALLTSTFAACGGVSRCINGIMGDKFPLYRPLMSGCSLFLTGTLAFISVGLTQYWMLACYSALFGAIGGENDLAYLLPSHL